MIANPKPDAVTAEEMFKLIEHLSSQIGDDIQVIFNHEALFKRSRAALVYQSAEITRLRAELAEARESARSAHAVCFAAGIEAAAKFIDKRLADYIEEHGSYDGTTGVTEFPGNGNEWVGEQEETAEAIRALTPPDITAAAARVLIPVFEEKHRDYMLSKGRNPDDYSSHFSMAVIDLRALAEVKP